MGAAEQELDARRAQFSEKQRQIITTAGGVIGVLPGGQESAIFSPTSIRVYNGLVMAERPVAQEPAPAPKSKLGRMDFPKTEVEAREFFNLCLANDRLSGYWGSPLVLAGYNAPFAVLIEAFVQMQFGKGQERHNVGGGTPFTEQRMQKISELIDSPKGMEYQIVKKLTEGMGFGDMQRFEREMFGAINYIVGLVIYRRKKAVELATAVAPAPTDE